MQTAKARAAFPPQKLKKERTFPKSSPKGRSFRSQKLKKSVCLQKSSPEKKSALPERRENALSDRYTWGQIRLRRTFPQRTSE